MQKSKLPDLFLEAKISSKYTLEERLDTSFEFLAFSQDLHKAANAGKETNR
ncbi:MAG: hypothetical protein ACFFD4_31480 [Candidatus Odinarchaeota archaeon]